MGRCWVAGRASVVAHLELSEFGQAVKAGQPLLVLEAMKMQNEIRAPKTGTIEKLHVTEGQAVNAGEVLAVVA